jgi:hypothetical protein
VQASLLLVNGGAAVTALQSTALSAPTRTWSGAFFVGGIILSLLAPVISSEKNEDVPGKITELIGYWASVTIDLLRSEEIERDWKLYGLGLAKHSKLPRLINYGSVAAFVIGCAIIGAHP